MSVLKQRRLACVVCVVGALVLSDALAQDGAPALEEITVTARKREKKLQDTPISISAFSGTELAARGVQTVEEVGRFSPNVSFEKGAAISGSSSATTFFIRGIGQTDFNLTIDPGVALYYDGVYVSRSIGSLIDVGDIASVQILRGPQGTLFGKNTIGGAVIVTPKAPSADLEAQLDVTTGSDSRFDVRAMLNVPIGDRLRLRAEAALLTRDGYQDRPNGATAGNQDQQIGRVALQADITDDIQNTLAIDGSYAPEQGPAISILRINEAALFPFVYNTIQNGTSCAAGVPGRQNNPRCQTTQWLTYDPYRSNETRDNHSHTEIFGIGDTLTWNTEPATIKLISAYRHLRSNFIYSSSGSPLLIADSGNDYAQHQWSEELQVSGKLFDDRLNWLTGLYYLSEKGTDRNQLIWAIGGGLSGGFVDNDSYAAFTQETYKLTDADNLTLGLRYTFEQKRFLPDQYLTNLDPFVQNVAFAGLKDPFGNPITGSSRLLPYVQSEKSAARFTPQVTIDHRFGERLLGYFTFSQGFKSGGFTQRVFPPLAQIPAFNPEKVSSYEVGLKTEWLDGRLRLNGALFRNDYTDLQITVTNFVAPTIQNAGQAVTQGAELEFEALVVDRLKVSGGAGYLDAHYENVPANAAPVTTSSKLPESPHWTGNVALTYDAWRSDLGDLSLTMDGSYRGGHFKDAPNTGALYQNGYGLLGVNAKFDTADGHWSASVGGTNLTSTKYKQVGYADLTGGGYAYAVYGRPAEWYLRLQYRY